MEPIFSHAISRFNFHKLFFMSSMLGCRAVQMHWLHLVNKHFQVIPPSQLLLFLSIAKLSLYLVQLVQCTTIANSSSYLVSKAAKLALNQKRNQHQFHCPDTNGNEFRIETFESKPDQLLPYRDGRITAIFWPILKNNPILIPFL